MDFFYSIVINIKTCKSIAIVLFLSCFLFSCKEPTIIGNWQRLTFPPLPDTPKLSTPISPEETLLILKDSSFKILRGKEPDTSSISGWHVGNTTGTWRMPNSKTINFLTREEKSLLPAEWSSNYGSMCMNFKILLLTKKRLILLRQSNLCGKDTIEYRR